MNQKAIEVKNTEQKLSRADIIAAVARLIAEQGLENLTMRNIARHVGCSVGTLPHYFEGKDDIVIAALNWSTERIMTRLGAMPDSEIRLEYLYPLIQLSLPMEEQSDMEWRVRLCLWDYAVTNEEMRASVSLIGDAAMNLMENIVVQLQEKNEIRKEIHPVTMAHTLYHLCIGAGFNMLHQPMQEREKQLKPLLAYIDSIRA